MMAFVTYLFSLKINRLQVSVQCVYLQKQRCRFEESIVTRKLANHKKKGKSGISYTTVNTHVTQSWG